MKNLFLISLLQIICFYGLTQRVFFEDFTINESLLKVVNTGDFNLFDNQHAIEAIAADGHGIRAESMGSFSAGVYGTGNTGVLGVSSFGNGVRGQSTTGFGVTASSTSHHGSRFSGDNANGFADIVLRGGNWNFGGDDGVIMSDPNDTGSDIFLVSNDAVIIELDHNGGETGNFEIWDQDDDVIFEVRETGDVYLDGMLLHASDRNKKEDIHLINTMDILSSLAAVPIYEWQYKGKDRRHIGAMAQDFHKAFKLGEDDTTIASIDAEGIALSAIQALYKQNQDLQDQINSLREKVQALEKK